MDYILKCLEKFEELPDKVKQAFGGDRAHQAIKEIEDQYKLDLAFVLILLAIDELFLEDLPAYLKLKYEISAEKAKIISQEIEDKIISSAINIITGYKEEIEQKDVNIEELIIKAFSDSFLKVLNLPAKDIFNFNLLTFAMFNERKLLEEKVINLFYNNQELISKTKIKIEDREVRASIANFIKDFIKNYGSEMPDNLMLANYLNTSPNVKKLTKKERDILNTVIKTYRNLVFFPDSMEGVPMEFWELIPTKTSYGEVSDVLADKKEVVNKEMISKDIKDKIIEKEIKKVAELTEGEPIKKLPEIKNSSLEQLTNMLSDYSVNSLEYKAIKQEINRLQKNGNNK